MRLLLLACLYKIFYSSGFNTGNEISVLYCSNGFISVREKFYSEASESDLALLVIVLSREVNTSLLNKLTKSTNSLLKPSLYGTA